MQDQPEGLSEPQAAGWWQASNDLWYPPETHPDATTATPQPPTMAAPPTMAPPPAPAAPPGWQPGYGPPPGPNQQGFGPGQPMYAPPKRKGTNPIVIVLAIIGGIFILGLGGCTVAGIMFARSADNVFAEFDGNFDNGFEILSCQSTLEEATGIENIDDRLEVVDQAIQNCGTISNFEEAMLDHPELLEPGQTVRELLEDRCSGGDITLSITRICTEIDEGT